MASKREREIAADNGMWLTHPAQLNVNIKRIVLTGRKHTKMVRPGDGCLNWETPGKSGRLSRYDHRFFP